MRYNFRIMTLAPVLPTSQVHRFTVEDYHRMAETGVLREGERLELIDGKVVEMSPIGIGHASSLDRLDEALRDGIGKDAHFRVQGPLRLDRHSEVQPDLLILRRREDFYAEGHPEPEDVLLLVEVADTSQQYDRQTKLPLYAAHGVPEVWLFDVPKKTIEIFRQPGPEGYADRQVVDAGDTLTCVAFPDLRVSVSRIL